MISAFRVAVVVFFSFHFFLLQRAFITIWPLFYKIIWPIHSDSLFKKPEALPELSVAIGNAPRLMAEHGRAKNRQTFVSVMGLIKVWRQTVTTLDEAANESGLCSLYRKYTFFVKTKLSITKKSATFGNGCYILLLSSIY